MEALKRFRSKGQQTVRVKRVTVEEGGQAIVGNVQHGLRTLAARRTNGSYAQKVYFAKLRERPIAAVRTPQNPTGRFPKAAVRAHRSILNRLDG